MAEDDEDVGPPAVPEPPVVDPTPIRRAPPRREALPPRRPNYVPPADPNSVNARYHISELPGYNGFADPDGEPIWDGNKGDGTPMRAPLPR